jgi:hypothetical protein
MSSTKTPDHPGLALARSLLEGDPTSPHVQERVFEQADKHGDHKLLAALARLDGLCPEVDRRIAAISSAAVLSAWLERDGHDQQALASLVETEKRVTVLEVIAAKLDLDDDVYATIASRGHHRTCLVLLQNESVSQDVRCEAAKVVAEHRAVSPHAPKIYEVRTVLDSCLDDASASAAVAHVVELGHAETHPQGPLRYLDKLAGHVASHQLDAQARGHMLDLIEQKVPELCKRVAAAANSDRQFGRRSPVGELMTQLSNLTAFVAANELSDHEHARAVKALERAETDRTALGNHVTELKDTLDWAGRVGELTAKAASDDPGSVTRAWQQVKSTKATAVRNRVAAVAADNPACPLETFAEIAKDFQTRVPDSRMMAAAIAHGQIDKQEMLVRKSFGPPGRSGFEQLTDPVGSALRTLDSRVPQRQMQWLTDNGHAFKVPARFLVDDTASGMLLRKAVMSTIEQQITPYPERWDALVSLLDGYDGTVGELIEAVCLLHPVDDEDTTGPDEDDSLCVPAAATTATDEANDAPVQLTLT